MLVVIAVFSAIRFLYLFLAAGVQALRNFRVQLPIQLASLAVVSAASWLLVSRNGVMGAAMAMLLATLVEMVAYSVAFMWTRRKAMDSSVATA